ncbi:hypothetical protein [Sphingomonas sp. OK281]|uniref:hypothetical protein n=1 Tax=Sphingomonas sp. OK281 TaxID=1881067 RepID=UPI001587CD91|nr:hypothetical protein [Sphingomonas sp. OK281]
MTAVYAKYDPRYVAAAVAVLQGLLTEVDQNARSWSAEYRVVKTGTAPPDVINHIRRNPV